MSRAWDPNPASDRQQRMNAAIDAALSAAEAAMVAHSKAHEKATGVLTGEVAEILHRLGEEKEHHG